MKEINYPIGARTGRAPVIRKLGALRRVVEQTPFVLNGRLMMAESVPAESDPDPALNGRPYFRIRDMESGRLYASLVFVIFF